MTMLNMKSKTPIRIRWQISDDLQEVLRIERASFEYPWCEEEFTNQLKQRNCIGLVAQQIDVQNSDTSYQLPIAYVVYELHKRYFRIINLAVDWSWRRYGVGSGLMEKLKVKLTPQRRGRIIVDVREKNLNAQLFFKSQGFLATKIVKECFSDTNEDAFTFEYRKGANE